MSTCRVFVVIFYLINSCSTTDNVTQENVINFQNTIDFKTLDDIVETTHQPNVDDQGSTEFIANIVQETVILQEDGKDTSKYNPIKLTMKQGLLMNQVLGFYALKKSKNDECVQHSLEFNKALRAFEPWALKMFDSSSKLQSGILLGNLFEFGSYLQCLEIFANTESGPIFGKHCTIKITPSISLIEKIVEFRNVSKKRFSIVEELVEKAKLRWSICVPHSCPTEDILEHFEKGIMEMATGLELKVTLDSNYCNTVFDKPQMGRIQYIVLAILGTFVIIALITAYLDYTSVDVEKHSFIKTFSAYSNYKRIISKGIIQPEFNFIHGLRFLSTCYVILGHRYIMFMIDPTINSLSVLDWILEYPSSLILGSTVSVDSFFMISGMLLGMGFFDQVTKTGQFNLWLFYIHRYLRITSPLAISVLIWCTLVQFLGDGTLMYDVYVNHQQNCQLFWWSTLLHVQSYINPGLWCNYPTWYLSCEMPFYYFSPILLYPLWKWPVLGVINCVVFYWIFFAVGFYLAWANEYSGDMLPITDHLLVTDYFKYYYTQPHVRIPPYIIGIGLGYFIFKTKGVKIEISKPLNLCLWTASLVIMIATILGSRVFQLESHVYNVWESASYLTFARSAWTVCLAWVVWACLNGYGGIVEHFLSSHMFRIFSRISYSMFLFHTIIQLSMGGNMKVSTYFSNFNAVYYAVADITIVSIFGFLFTIFFEIPMNSAASMMFNPKRAKKSVKPMPINK